MNLFIGDNIKRLRREKNITQEKLAEHLNISCPAISKWERNETYPDITMILPIASYFGVSTDELLGFDMAKNEEIIKNYLSKYNDLLQSGKWCEAENVIRSAHAEFPDDFRIIYYYMHHIIGGKADNSAETVLSHSNELTSLCERILDECTVDYIRNGAIDILAKIHKANGNSAQALELLDRLPDFFNTKGQKSEQLFDKNTEEWWYWLHQNLYYLSDFAIDKISKVIWFSDELSFDEKVSSTIKLIEFLEQICTDTGYGLGYKPISSTYSQLAGKYNRAGDYENACKYYDLTLYYAKMLDDFAESDRQIPHTKNSIKRELITCTGSKKYNQVKSNLIWLEGSQFCEKLRETENYAKLLEKYRPFAKDY